VAGGLVGLIFEYFGMELSAEKKCAGAIMARKHFWHEKYRKLAEVIFPLTSLHIRTFNTIFQRTAFSYFV
jgi:hypothetical protein